MNPWLNNKTHLLIHLGERHPAGMATRDGTPGPLFSIHQDKEMLSLSWKTLNRHLPLKTETGICKSTRN